MTSKIEPIPSFEQAKTQEALLVQLCFHFAVLMEYQLIDLQSNVREFVDDMSNAVQKMDGLVVAEGKSAQELFETMFTKNEASAINDRASLRADDIFEAALGQISPSSVKSNVSPTPTVSHHNKTNESLGAEDKIWSDIAKKFESFARMEERLRPQVYTMIKSLNFEDIQTQRLEHALKAQKTLNIALMNYLQKGINNCPLEELKGFANKLVKETRESYTMTEERNVFDQVFYQHHTKK